MIIVGSFWMIHSKYQEIMYSFGLPRFIVKSNFRLFVITIKQSHQLSPQVRLFSTPVYSTPKGKHVRFVLLVRRVMVPLHVYSGIEQVGVGLLDDVWISKLHINFRDKAIPEARATKHSNGPHRGHWKRQMGCGCSRVEVQIQMSSLDMIGHFPFIDVVEDGDMAMWAGPAGAPAAAMVDRSRTISRSLSPMPQSQFSI